MPTSPKKWISHLFKLHHSYSLLNFIGLYPNSQKEKENRFLFTRFSVKHEIGKFHVVVAAKKCTKKRGARAELLFCQTKPITFTFFYVDVMIASQAPY